MHGRKKESASQKKERKNKEDEKAQLYIDLENDVVKKRDSQQFDVELLELISKALLVIPEHASLWSWRRTALQHIHQILQNDIDNVWISVSVALKELELTEKCMSVNPKAYGVWHHRRWIIDRVAEDDYSLDKELVLCGKLLDVDSRNFHCWDYRRWIIRKLVATHPDRQLEIYQSEFAYTTELICHNFSNYSAWHQRSIVLPFLLQSPDITPSFIQKELDFVHQALYTESKDLSAWVYYRTLLPFCRQDSSFSSLLAQEYDIIRQLFQEEPQCLGSIRTVCLMVSLSSDAHFRQQIINDIQSIMDVYHVDKKDLINTFLNETSLSPV